MPSKQFTLNNPGTIPVTIQSINFRDPPDIGHVANLTNLGGAANETGNATLAYNLAVGASQTFSIDYNSSTAAPGTYEGRVLISGSDRASTVITSTIIIPVPTTTTTTTTTTTVPTTTVPPTTHISGFASGTGCYFAKSGFSLDRISGDIWLTAGTVPQHYLGSNCGNNANVPWELLKFRGTGTNQLSNDSTSNIYQLTNTYYDHWAMMDSINISAIPIGSSGNLSHLTYSVSVNGAGWPFAFGNPNYIVRRTGTNSATIELGQNAAWGTGDNGWNITISNWFSLTNISFGGSDEVMGTDANGNPVVTAPFVKGVKTLTW
jgi:hypothetical protein